MYKEALKTKRAHHHNEYDLYADVEKIKTALADATRGAKGKATDMFNDSIHKVHDKSVDLEKDVAKYVAKKPFRSLGAALLVGVVIGYILHRKG